MRLMAVMMKSKEAIAREWFSLIKRCDQEALMWALVLGSRGGRFGRRVGRRAMASRPLRSKR